MRCEDVLELRPVHQGLVKLRVFTGGIAKDVLHTTGHQLFGKASTAGACELLHRTCCTDCARRWRCLRMGGVVERGQHQLGGAGGHANRRHVV